MSQFRTRLQTYLDKWLHLAGKDKTRPEDIMDLFAMEQLINACGNNLVVFLKERKPKTSDDIVELAEQYIDAHGQSGATQKGRGTRKSYIADHRLRLIQTQDLPGSNAENVISSDT
ncbi:hypothetical protein RRG08_047583 [Elysia crispata]|uniref:SCAN box domain-containing protein n=1 Tax=Elysia crispata TaxID=231223 RepID=A0AAE1CJN9_9GAST|nr:hypothetical protein RRG08_047583 [Elysia crispata]